MYGTVKKFSACFLLVILMMSVFLCSAYAAPAPADGPADAAVAAAADDSSVTVAKAIAAAIVVGLATLGGGLGMGLAASHAEEGISRQPEAEGKIRTTFMLGLVFIETAIIYALIIAILVIFVL